MVAQQIACSIVGFRLDYCNSLLVNCSNRNLDKLQRVQDNLARVVCNSNRSASAGPLLRSLHWLPISNSPNFVIWWPLFNSQATLLIWSAHTVSLVRCGRPHRSFCQFHCTTWTLLLVVSLLLLQDSGTLLLWTVEMLHLLTHLRPGLRHFSLLQYNLHCSTHLYTMACYKCIDWLIDISYFMQWSEKNTVKTENNNVNNYISHRRHLVPQKQTEGTHITHSSSSSSSSSFYFAQQYRIAVTNINSQQDSKALVERQ